MGTQCSDSLQKYERDYKSIWTPIIGEGFILEAQDDNKHDKQAVAVMKYSCVSTAAVEWLNTCMWPFIVVYLCVSATTSGVYLRPCFFYP